MKRSLNIIESQNIKRENYLNEIRQNLIKNKKFIEIPIPVKTRLPMSSHFEEIQNDENFTK